MRPAVLLSLALCFSLVAAPAFAQEPPPVEPTVQQPPPVPQGWPPPPPPVYYPPPRPVIYVPRRRWNLFAIGAGVFGSTWLGNVYSAINSEEWLGVIPLVGPWLMLSNDNGLGTNILLGLDGAAQAAGVTLMLLGVLLKKQVPAYALVPTGRGLAFSARW